MGVALAALRCHDANATDNGVILTNQHMEGVAGSLPFLFPGVTLTIVLLFAPAAASMASSCALEGRISSVLTFPASH
jgi:hypothetical protein